MKKLLLVIVTCFLVIEMQSQVSKIVNVTTAGTLSSYISDSEFRVITNLTVTGTIDSVDFKYIKGLVLSNVLTDIDLSGSTVVNKMIPSNNFYSCSKLTRFVFPMGITTINASAFENCSGLSSLTIPTTVTSIGEWAFARCTGLTSITIPSLVTSLGASAFQGCTQLTTIVNASAITSIANQTFYGCSKLTFFEIPSLVTTIGDKAFYNCNTLDSVSFKTTSLTSLGNYVFSGCTKLRSITIPTPTISIGNYALENCSSLTSAIIASTVVTYNSSIFSGCNALKTVTMPNSNGVLDITLVNELKPSLLSLSLTGTIIKSDFSRLTSFCSYGIILTIDLSGTRSLDYTIPSYAFNSKTCLKTFKSPKGIKTVEDFAFAFCSSLTTMILASTVTTLGNDVFSGCTALPTIDLPLSLLSMGEMAFDNCQALQSITIPNSVSVLPSKAFDQCNALKSVVLPINLTSIGDGAFYGCSSLTSIDFPNILTSIGQAAFYRCSNLSALVLPQSLTTISQNAFGDCMRLSNVSIPSSVTSIATKAFTLDTALSSFYVYYSTPLPIVATVFDLTDINNCMLYVPTGTKTTYQQTAVWKDFKFITEVEAITTSKTTVVNSGIIEQTTNIVVTTPASWTVKSNQSWIILDSVSVTKGNGSFSYVTQLNRTTNSRSGIITLYSASNVAIATISVTQEAGNPTMVSTELENGIKVYPNPTSGGINVQTEGSAIVEIYSLQGLSIMKQAISQSCYIPLNIPSGVYLIQIKNAHSVQTVMFILK